MDFGRRHFSANGSEVRETLFGGNKSRSPTPGIGRHMSPSGRNNSLSQSPPTGGRSCSPSKFAAADAPPPDLFSAAPGTWSPRRRRPSHSPSRPSPLSSPSKAPTSVPQRAAGVSYTWKSVSQGVWNESRSDLLRAESPEPVDERLRGISLTWTGWSGRKTSAARNSSPGVVGSLEADLSEVQQADCVKRELNAHGMQQKGRCGLGHSHQHSSSPALCLAGPPADTLPQVPSLERGSRQPPHHISAGVGGAIVHDAGAEPEKAIKARGRRSVPLHPASRSSATWGIESGAPAALIRLPEPVLTAGGAIAMRDEAERLLQLRSQAAVSAPHLRQAPALAFSPRSSYAQRAHSPLRERLLRECTDKVSSAISTLIANDQLSRETGRAPSPPLCLPDRNDTDQRLGGA